AGQVPPALLSSVRIAAAAEPATASAGNGNNTTIGNKPPAPPVGPPTAAPTPPPTTAPTPPAPAPGPGPAPTPAPTAAPVPKPPAPAPTPAPVPTPPPKILKPSLVESDNLAFVGSRAAHAQRMVAELAGGDAALAARLTVAPGVEIRSPGRLSLESEWNLVPASGSRVGEAMRLSLRAGGDLALLNSLSDGFAAARSATDKRAIAANGVAMAGRAASFRLVAGADLAAADPMALNEAADATKATGSLVIGRPGSSATATPPIVFIRSTTGSIAMAAAGDINLGVALNAQGRNGQVRIYTTGEALPTPSTQDLNRLGLRLSDQLIPNSPSGNLGPFFDHAGAISLQAGRDVLSLPGYKYPSGGGQPQSVQYVADWWWRQLSPNAQQLGLMFWSRYDQFAQGIASFGGGDIAVRAGRDLVDLELSTPASGYRLREQGLPGGKDYVPGAGTWMPGGSLRASAGRDVLGGLYNAGGAQASLSAGSRIGGGSGRALSYAAPQLFHLDTRWSVQA
ncbi:MAG: hypothetical protein ACOVLH_03635, partial [Roseateles sp.]